MRVGDFALAFPTGSSGQTDFKWTNVDVDWEDGQTISVRIVPTLALQLNSPATGLPSTGGTLQVGETLTVDTSGITDADGLTKATFTYRWIAEGSDISGANGSSYTLSSHVFADTIQVRVTFKDDANNKETLISAATARVAAKPLELRITGEARVGDTLKADTTGIVDEDGLDNPTFHYTWSNWYYFYGRSGTSIPLRSPTIHSRGVTKASSS